MNEMNELRQNILSELSEDNSDIVLNKCELCYACYFNPDDAINCHHYTLIKRLEKIADGKANPRFVAELILKYGSDEAVKKIFREIINL